MAQKSPKNKKNLFVGLGKMFLLILIVSILGVVVYAAQQGKDFRGKAAEVKCVPNVDGECVEPVSAGSAGVLDAGVTASDNVLLPGSKTVASCQKQVFLKVDYTGTYCKPPRPCENVQPRTSVGWVGDGTTGSPFKIYGDMAMIPLTDSKGVWIHDDPLYRSNLKVNGLGLTRIGDGRILLSHATSVIKEPPRDLTRPFQAIDAVMYLTGATTKAFTNGDLGIAPDQPILNNGRIPGHYVDYPFDGEWATPPNFNNIPDKSCCGGDEVTWSEGGSNWAHYTRIGWPGDDYIMTLKCPEKPITVKCDLYPIALNKETVANAKIGQVLSDIWNGTGSGSFGWLTWAGSVSEPTLSTSLTPPGDSKTYVNPKNSSDHIVSVGDWIKTKPGVSNSSGSALDTLKTQDIIVPVWDESSCQGGSNNQYKTWNYAKVRINSYDLAGKKSGGTGNSCNDKPGTNKITATFKGFVNCEQ